MLDFNKKERLPLKAMQANVANTWSRQFITAIDDNEIGISAFGG